MSAAHPFYQMSWFIGVVEDINDPEGVNRVRVRCLQYHTEDRASLPTEQLPWATFGNGSASMSAPMVLPGDWVFGIFLDGKQAQQPIIIIKLDGIPGPQDKSRGFSDPSGIYPKVVNKPTTSPLARADLSTNNPISYSRGSITSDVPTASGGNWSEPKSEYNAKYPHNHVIHTDGGNVIELDDTDGVERIQIFHASGTFTEVHPNGSIVHRSVGDKFEVVANGQNVIVGGDCNITSSGNMNLLAGKTLTLGGKDIVISASESLKITSQGEMDIKGGAQLNVQGEGVSVSGGPLFAVDADAIEIESGESQPASAAAEPPDVPAVKIPRFVQ